MSNDTETKITGAAIEPKNTTKQDYETMRQIDIFVLMHSVGTPLFATKNFHLLVLILFLMC